MTLSLVLLVAVVTGSAIAFVVSPLLWRETDAPSVGPEADPTTDLHVRRERAFVALRELEEDHRLGKLDPEVYRTSRAQLEDTAARILQALDATTAPSVPARRRGAPVRARRRAGVAP
ncbi:MAG TPA: hypothetical protein VFX49_03785 [Chloroflexota bacterium]|nr:hypothetical protein [Chloroflexota bacterium]